MYEVKTPDIAVVLADSIIDAPPGAIKFFDAEGFEPRGFNFQCPCGCGALGSVRVAGPHAWQWNGSRDKPTVRPSVLLGDTKGNPHWHGWLTDGVWKSC